jgi:hypothetical protein
MAIRVSSLMDMIHKRLLTVTDALDDKGRISEAIEGRVQFAAALGELVGASWWVKKEKSRWSRLVGEEGKESPGRAVRGMMQWLQFDFR